MYGIRRNCSGSRVGCNLAEVVRSWRPLRRGLVSDVLAKLRRSLRVARFYPPRGGCSGETGGGNCGVSGVIMNGCTN